MDDITIIWGSSLLIALVVIGVVWYLLHLIKSTAGKINETVEHIWTEGKLLANNTIQIPGFLSVTNRSVKNINRSAGHILKFSEIIEDHTVNCPGCPECMLKIKH